MWEKSVNERDLGLPRGRHGYEGDWSKMREPPPKWQLYKGIHAYIGLHVLIAKITPL